MIKYNKAHNEYRVFNWTKFDDIRLDSISTSTDKYYNNKTLWLKYN